MEFLLEGRAESLDAFEFVIGSQLDDVAIEILNDFRTLSIGPGFERVGSFEFQQEGDFFQSRHQGFTGHCCHDSRMLPAGIFARLRPRLGGIDLIALSPVMAEPKIEFYNAAIDAVQSGQLPEALKAIEASLIEGPNDVQSWQLYAVILNALGETEKAGNAMAKVKELGLSEADELVMKAADAIGQGKTGLAITHYEDALELEPERAEVYVSYALVLMQGGYAKDAVEASAKAVELSPQDASAWYARGRILRLSNKKEEALEAYDKALALEPGLILASYECGMVLAETGQLQEALDCFEKVLKEHPEDAAAAEAKANILKAMEE